MTTTQEHAAILTGRIGSTLLLQLDIGGMNIVHNETVHKEDLARLEEIARRFADTLTASQITPGSVYVLDSTHVVGDTSIGPCKTLSPDAAGLKYVEKFQGRVTDLMRQRGNY